MQIALARELSAFVWEVMRVTMPQADGSPAVITARTPRAIVAAEPKAKKKGRSYDLKSRPKGKPAA